MKSIKILKLLLISIFALTIGSCDREVDPDSVVQNFEAYSPALDAATPAVTANENDGEQTFTFHFTLDERQLNEIQLNVGAGASSTAKEGVDFDILTPEFDFGPFEGSNGFDVEVVVYPDYEPEEDETIYLTFSTSGPSGVDKSEVLVINLEDANLPLCDYDLDNIAGARTGIDISLDGQDPYDSEVVIKGTTGDFTITGLGVGWMTDFWGEVITQMRDVDMEVVVVNDYLIEITIPSQQYLNTTYGGAPQDVYLIEGTGTLDKCQKKITIEYSLTNNDTDWAVWTHDNGYMTEELFTAVLDIP
jgi:hypothetical protein